MRSLFAKILLWFVATTLISALAVVLTTMVGLSAPRARHQPFAMLLTFQLTQARQAYEQGGAPALKETLERLRAGGLSRGMFLDSSGRDLMTGQDRSDLLRESEDAIGLPVRRGDQVLIGRPDDDGKYWFFLQIPRRRWFLWFLRPQYLWILGVAALFCYLLARHLTTPVRQLQTAVRAFGHGDLRARASSGRKDELGQLAQTFDQMADRIETLLTAERRLLLDLSHELRSPLARLNVAVELARSGEDRERALDRIQKESDRLEALVSELLQVTRAEGDPETRRKEILPLDELVEDVVKDAVIEAESRGCGLRFTNGQPVSVCGDPELLRRAVENVVRNAIRYSPRETTVEVSLDRTPKSALVRVRDYGPGVPEDALPRIFDPFYRVAADRGRDSGGVGLGLSIARRAVELHKGRLHAENKKPGLMVEIEIPV